MLNKKASGFTLLELMIVVGIIGILSAIVYPGYQKSVMKSRRADAKGALQSFAGAMEKNFTVRNSYCDAGGANGTGTAVSACGTSTSDTGAPTIFATQSPVAGGEAYYNLTISAVTTTSFTLSATPTGKQATDICGTLTLTNTGVRDALVSGSSVNTTNSCW